MREKKAFNKAWMKKLLMTQQEDDNKSLRNFSSSTSCLNWQDWTHFSQHGRGKGRASNQAGSNLPWNNTSSKTNPSPLLLQRLHSLESTKTQFPLTPDEIWPVKCPQATSGSSKEARTYQSSMNRSWRGADLPLGPGFRIFQLHYICSDQHGARQTHQPHSPNSKKPEINQIWQRFPLLFPLCPLT